MINAVSPLGIDEMPVNPGGEFDHADFVAHMQHHVIEGITAADDFIVTDGFGVQHEAWFFLVLPVEDLRPVG